MTVDSTTFSSVRDWIALTTDPLEIAAALRHVSDVAAGGTDTFIGTARAEEHPVHGALIALEYSAYEAMASEEMHRLVSDARVRWPICKIALLHRLGRCAVGEASVVIAVSAPHRGEAFEACRALIDNLKKTVPIWKKDIFSHSEQWHSSDRSRGG